MNQNETSVTIKESLNIDQAVLVVLLRDASNAETSTSVGALNVDVLQALSGEGRPPHSEGRFCPNKHQ